jgi:hypothetical protein
MLQKAQSSDFLRFSGISDGKIASSAYKAAKANLDNEVKRFSTDLGISFKKAFHTLSSTAGLGSSGFSSWYPQLNKAAAYMQKVPTTNLGAEAQQKITGLT